MGKRQKKVAATSVRPIDSVRLAVLEMSRVTEMTAILSSYLIGRGLREHGANSETSQKEAAMNFRKPRDFICYAFLKFLQGSLTHNAKLVHVDPFWLGWSTETSFKTQGRRLCDANMEKLWGIVNSQGGLGRLHIDMTGTAGIFQPLDLVMSPLEGVGDTGKGLHGGPASLIAGGPEGAFAKLEDGQYCSNETKAKDSRPSRFIPHYFMLAFENADFGKEVIDHLKKNGVNKRDDGKPLPVHSVKEIRSVFSRYVHNQKLGTRLRAISHPCVATIGVDDKKRGFKPLLGGGIRTRVFSGSATAAAVATLYGRLSMPLFAAVVRRTPFLMASVAARALDRKIIAIPLEMDSDNCLVCPSNARFLTEEIVDPNTFLVMTGVAAHPLLRGVRVDSNGCGKTQTIAFNARSRSIRTINHYRDLVHDQFQCVDYESKGNAMDQAWKVIEDFRARLGDKF